MTKIKNICLIALYVSFSCTIVACKPRQTLSEEKHNPSQPVRGQEAWQWADTSEDEYFSVIVPYLKLPDKAHFISRRPQIPASPETELTTRMQFWLNLIHQRLKKDFSAELKHVPTPQAIVMRNAEANAFVSPVPICIDVTVRLNPKIPVSNSTTIKRINFTTDGEFADDSTDTDPICLHKAIPAERLKDMLKWFNAKSDGCFVKFDVDPNLHKPVFTVSENCPLDPELEGIALAKSLSVVTTSNWVTINTGLISKIKNDEWMMIPTLVHELGHYYRSHLTAFPKEYNFFYHLDNSKNPHKPTPEPALKKFGTEVYESAKFRARHDVNEQIFDSSLYEPITALVHRYCKQHSKACSKINSCYQLNKMIENGTLSDAMGGFPSEELAEESISIYKKYEQLVSDCAPSIRVTNSKTKDSLSTADISLMFKRADLSTLVTLPVVKQTTLSALIVSLQNQIVTINSTATERIQNAEEQKLARYTIEMEADEFGLEQFAKLGFDPKDWIEADFVFNRTTEDSVAHPILNSTSGIYRGNVDNNNCEKIYRDGWKYLGRPFIPDRGGFYDPHPYNCFRTYDMWQEISIHGYTKQSIAVAPPKGRPWRELAELAESLTPNNTEAEHLQSAAAMNRTRARLNKVFYGCPMLAKSSKSKRD